MPIDSLIEILHTKSEIKKCDETLIIKEIDNKNNKGKLEKVTLKNLDNIQICSHKLDLYNPISPHLKKKNNKGINKGVDAFVVLKNEKDEEYILFLELKSTTINKSQVANKFFASTAFIHHLNILLDKFYDCSMGDYNAGAVLFSIKQKSGRVKKFKMRPDFPDYKIQQYKNKIGKSIQVLEIEKETASKFNVPITKVLEKCRTKKFKNWP